MIVNRNSTKMTTKQKILKAVYPLFTGISRLLGKKDKTLENAGNKAPASSFYDLAPEKNGGGTIDMKAFKGKKVLIVNTASNCGYTGQYEELQQLYTQYQDQLVVIGFPANDFKEQEKGTDEEIAQFCKLNYGVSFPLAKKSVVIKSSDQNPVFIWLTDKSRNGWNEQQPVWNFSKYLIDEKGVLTHYFDPSVSPLGEEVINAVTEK
jgi:glutathione peroxidase